MAIVLACWAWSAVSGTSWASSGSDVTSYPLPAASGGAVADPSGIVAGSDAAVWAVDRNSGVIWRIAMSGVVTSIPIAGIRGDVLEPTGIAAGANGTVWVTAGFSVSHVTSAGVVASYVLPAAGDCAASDPSGIVLGPDGAVWVSDPNDPAARLRRRADLPASSDSGVLVPNARCGATRDRGDSRGEPERAVGISDGAQAARRGQPLTAGAATQLRSASGGAGDPHDPASDPWPLRAVGELCLHRAPRHQPAFGHPTEWAPTLARGRYRLVVRAGATRELGFRA